jgi:hypothetical protein
VHPVRQGSIWQCRGPGVAEDNKSEAPEQFANKSGCLSNIVGQANAIAMCGPKVSLERRLHAQGLSNNTKNDCPSIKLSICGRLSTDV